MTTEIAPGTLFAGRFRVDSAVGRGGLGTVYRATHEVLGRVVAIKVLHLEALGSADVLQRFEREARAASRIDHPNVTHVLDYGHTDEGIPYLVMELVEGPTLAVEIARCGPFALPRALSVLRQITDGLRAAHGAGVLHRDLKPSNVLLSHSRDGGERAMLCDFGLAKIVEPGDGDSPLSARGLQLGTPEFMSPEHCRGEALDAQSDLYSLGLLAFAVLAGHPPFQGPAPRVVAAQVTRPAPALDAASGRRDLPPVLVALVARCLRKARAERPESAAAVLAELSGV